MKRTKWDKVIKVMGGGIKKEPEEENQRDLSEEVILVLKTG